MDTKCPLIPDTKYLRTNESDLDNLRSHDDGVCVGQFFKLESLFRREFRAHVKLKLNTP